MLQTMQWTGQALRLLDQTRLPAEIVYVDITTAQAMHDAIRRLVVRGAPAIGVAAAFGLYLGVREDSAADIASFQTSVKKAADYLASSRPTAVNLFWALARMRRVINSAPTPKAAKDCLLAEAIGMMEEDRQTCRRIGQNGLELLQTLTSAHSPSTGRRSRTNLITHCNAGSLATVQYGTALSPIYVGVEQGLSFHVHVDETRPLLQGSRITAMELHQAGVPVTVICDNMAATVLAGGKVDAAIVGADRIAANGDTANKIGTHGLAILCRHFGVPFIVAAPMSTIDFDTPDGRAIPIEERDGREITDGFGRPTAPAGVGVFNPAFDVTPASLITAIVTESGVARPPNGVSLCDLRTSQKATSP